MPILTAQLGAFIEKLPGYVSRMQALAIEPNREWLRSILGEGVADAQVSDLVKQGAGWITAFIKSLWSGGQALLSIFSLVVVTPVVAFYLLYDWNRMVAAVDNWIPLQHRETVRGLAREMDRGDCRLRARADGGLPDPRIVLRGRADADWPEFRPADRTRVRDHHVHSLCRLDDRAGAGGGVAIAQFWPEYTPIIARARPSSSSASSLKAMCWRRSWSAKASACIRSG